MRFREPEPIEVEFRDRKRLLVYSMGSLRKADKQIKELRGDASKSIYTIINEEFQELMPLLRAINDPKAEMPASVFTMSMDFLSTMMWAAMLVDEPNLTFDQAENLIRDPLRSQVVVALLIHRTWFGEEDSNRNQNAEVSPLAPSSNGNDSAPSLALNSE